MGTCPYVDENQSGISNGYYCSLTNEYINWKDAHDLCVFENGVDNCPYANGTPILTQEIANEILSVFNNSVNNCISELDYMTEQVFQIARRTSMESINEITRILNSYDFSFPTAYGIYQNIVTLTSEKAVAQQLEANLTHVLAKIKLHCFVNSFSACPVVTSQDFNDLSRTVNEYGYRAANMLSYFEVSSEASFFSEPAESFLASMTKQIVGMVNYLTFIINQAQSQFNSAVNSISSSDHNINSILDYADVNWSFGE